MQAALERESGSATGNSGRAVRLLVLLGLAVIAYVGLSFLDHAARADSGVVGAGVDAVKSLPKGAVKSLPKPVTHRDDGGRKVRTTVAKVAKPAKPAVKTVRSRLTTLPAVQKLPVAKLPVVKKLPAVKLPKVTLPVLGKIPVVPKLPVVDKLPTVDKLPVVRKVAAAAKPVVRGPRAIAVSFVLITRPAEAVAECALPAAPKAGDSGPSVHPASSPVPGPVQAPGDRSLSSGQVSGSAGGNAGSSGVLAASWRPEAAAFGCAGAADLTSRGRTVRYAGPPS